MRCLRHGQSVGQSIVFSSNFHVNKPRPNCPPAPPPTCEAQLEAGGQLKGRPVTEKAILCGITAEPAGVHLENGLGFGTFLKALRI